MDDAKISDPEVPKWLLRTFYIQVAGILLVPFSVLLFVLLVVVGSGPAMALPSFVNQVLWLPFFAFYGGITLALVPAPFMVALSAVAIWRIRRNPEASVLPVFLLFLEVLLCVLLVSALSEMLFYWRHPEYLEDSRLPGSGIFTPEKDRR